MRTTNTYRMAHYNREENVSCKVYIIAILRLLINIIYWIYLSVDFTLFELVLRKNPKAADADVAMPDETERSLSIGLVGSSLSTDLIARTDEELMSSRSLCAIF